MVSLSCTMSCTMSCKLLVGYQTFTIWSTGKPPSHQAHSTVELTPLISLLTLPKSARCLMCCSLWVGDDLLLEYLQNYEVLAEFYWHQFRAYFTDKVKALMPILRIRICLQLDVTFQIHVRIPAFIRSNSVTIWYDTLAFGSKFRLQKIFRKIQDSRQGTCLLELFFCYWETCNVVLE